MIAKALLFKAIMGIMNAVLPGSGSIGSLGASFGSAVAGVQHAGGIAGSGDSPYRAVSANMFSAANRYHVGGIAGLKSGEVPIIANAGEAILPTVRLPDGTFGVKAIGSGAGKDGGSNNTSTININVNVETGASTASTTGGTGGNHADTAKKLGALIAGAVQEEMVKQKRPGGLLSGM